MNFLLLIFPLSLSLALSHSLSVSLFLVLLFQRFPPLELDSLQVYILRDTLFSSQ